MSLTINNKEHVIRDEHHLSQLIDKALAKDFSEIWIDGHGSTTLCLLTNPEHAFAMYLKHEGDPGHSSRSSNPPSIEFEDFKLANGQVDEYPVDWLIPKEKGKSILLDYYKTGKRSDQISWMHD